MGTCCWPEKLSSSKERVIKELVIQGHEFASHLQFLLQKPSGDFDGCLALVDELVGKILRSFDETLSVITSSESAGGEVCQNLASSQGDSACYDDRRSEDSGESKKRLAIKNKRGCYKRKKISQSWTTVCPTIEDGHGWRKYGQKEILNAKYPRSYFRCTRKHDQGCKATKQVQRMEENPDMYHTTYIGHHTCRDILKAPQMITDSDPWESYNYNNIVTSHSKIPKYEKEEEEHHPFIGSSSKEPKIKQEESKEDAPSDLTGDVSSLDSIVWKDLIPFEESVDEPTMILRPDCGVVVDSVHAYSCTEVTSQSLDMDFFVRSIDFDCDFHFDESELCRLQ
ncbi:unnamed protein product [Dovyalis caffra]|uniref:WRKY domain-containing protein n=1 Tax=Dovyalis caffra TaxID=77055 RepID=A0AAV1RW26_9ROSI|nr:unnamed protein product [Dovyalis caffra]